MTIFKNNNNLAPFKKFRALYKEADSLNQKNIEGIAISSYSKLFKEVDSRYVNLKYLDDDKFIFSQTINLQKHINSYLITRLVD